jgi:hypothetical protein
MHRSTYTLAFAFAFSLTPACGDDGDGGSGESIEGLCQKGCTLSASLACPNDNASTCLADCVDGAAALPEACESQANDALQCAVNRPASDWECDSEGESTLKENVCDEEATPLLLCLFGTSEDGMCPFEEDDECDDPTGTDLCPPGTDLVDCA